jgi:hypothetical protein
LNLFNADSTATTSVRFELKAQSTVYAVGLTGTDSIVFEMCLYQDKLVAPTTADCADSCDPGFPITVPELIGTVPLTCSCPATTRQRVALTAGMSHVVLDNPQNVWVRAVYTGTNLGDFVVWVEKSDIQNVTDGMRSCCSDSGTSGVGTWVWDTANTGAAILTLADGSTITVAALPALC